MKVSTVKSFILEIATFVFALIFMMLFYKIASQINIDAAFNFESFQLFLVFISFLCFEGAAFSTWIFVFMVKEYFEIKKFNLMSLQKT